MIRPISVILLISLATFGCSPKEPPAIENLKEMGISELQSYVDTNCQTDFRLHARCISASGELSQKRNARVLGQDVKP